MSTRDAPAVRPASDGGPELSLTDLGRRLWAGRAFVVTAVVLGVGLAFVGVTATSATSEMPVQYFIELRGIADGRAPEDGRTYPSGAAFSPQDLLSPEVLRELADDQRLEVPIGRLRAAFTVDFGSPLSAGVMAKYRRQLQGRALDVVAIDRLNELFSEELRSTTRRGLRIEVDVAALGIDEALGRRLAVALPETWSRVFTDRYRVLLPVMLPALAPDRVELPDLETRTGVLRAESVLGQIREGIAAMATDGRLAYLATESGTTAARLLYALEEYESLYFLPLYSAVFQEQDAVGQSYVREVRLSIAERDLELSAIDTTVRDLQRFRSNTDVAASESGGESALVQIDDSTLARLMRLSSDEQLVAHLAATLERRRELVAERARLTTRLARMNPESVAGVEDLAALRAPATEQLGALLNDYRELRLVALDQLRLVQGRLFEPVGVPETRSNGWRLRLVLAMAAAGSLALLVSTSVVLVRQRPRAG